MADKVRVTGVALEIQGAKEFDANLKKAAQNIKQTTAELKRSQSQYKLNENSVTSLADKQSALAKALEAQKSKTAELNKILEAAKEKYGEESKQVSAVATEIAKSETYEADLEQQMKETQKAVEDQSHALKKYVAELTTAGKGVEGFGDKLSGVGKKLTVGATVPVAGLATAAVAAFNEVDDGYDVIINKTGATGKALEQMQDVAKNVYTSMPVEMSDVGAAVGELNTRLDIQGEALENATKQTLQFARVNNADAESTIQKVTRYMGDASIEASKYGSVLDDLTVAGQKTGISVDTLAEYLTKYGAPLRALGFETKESIALFSQWEKSGVNVEIAFSGMKKAISKWASAGKDSRKEFKKTLSAIKACPDIAAATTKAIEVFGAKAGPDLADAIQGGRFAYEDLLSVIESSEGALSGTYNSLLDGADSANVALNNAKITLSNLGDTVLTSATPMIEDFTECIENLGEWYSSLDSGTQKAIVKTGAFLALLGPGMSLLGKAISTGSKAVKKVKEIAKCFKTSKIAAKLFAKETDGAATAMNNMASASKAASIASKGVLATTSAVTLGVAALATAYITAKKRQDELTDKMSTMPNTILSTISAMSSATSVLSGYNAESATAADIISKCDEGIAKAQENIIGIAAGAAAESRSITDAEAAEIERLVGMIDSYTSKKLEAYTEQQTIVRAMIENETQMTSSTAESYISSAQQAYSQIAQKAQEERVKMYQKANGDETLQKIADDKYKKAVAAAQETYADSVAAVTNKYYEQNIAADENIKRLKELNQEWENANATQVPFSDSKTATLKSINDEMAEIINSPTGEAIAKMQTFAAEAELYSGNISNISESVIDINDTVCKNFEHLPDDVKDTFKEAMNGALEGLKEKEPELYEEASTSCDGVLKTMRETFDEHSPSKETRKIFRYAMDGAIEGLKDKEKELYKKADAIAANTAKRLKKGLEVNSPSRVVRRIFWSVGEGGILGLKDKEKELYATSTRLASGVAKHLSIQRPAFDVSFGSIAAAQARANRIASSISNTNNYTTSTDYSQHDYGIHVDRVVVNGNESDAYRWLEQVEYQRQLQARARGAR